MSQPLNIYPKAFIVQTGVAGTARSPLAASPDALNGAHFWDLAAATFWIDKAAWMGIQMADISPPLSSADGLPVCPEAAATALEAILHRGRTPALAEWLSLAREAHVSAPPHLLPHILQLLAKSHVIWEAPGARAVWLSEQHPEWKHLFDKKHPDIRQQSDIRAPEDPKEALPWAVERMNDARQQDIQTVWSALAYHTNPNAVHTWDAARDLPKTASSSDWLRTRDIWFFRLRMKAAFNLEPNQHIP